MYITHFPESLHGLQFGVACNIAKQFLEVCLIGIQVHLNGPLPSTLKSPAHGYNRGRVSVVAPPSGTKTKVILAPMQYRIDSTNRDLAILICHNRASSDAVRVLPCGCRVVCLFCGRGALARLFFA